MNQYALEQYLYSLASISENMFIESIARPTFTSPFQLCHLPFFVEKTAHLPRKDYKFSYLVEIFLFCCDEFGIRDIPNLKAVTISSSIDNGFEVIGFLEELRKRLNNAYTQVRLAQENHTANCQFQNVLAHIAPLSNPTTLHITLFFDHAFSLDVLDVTKYFNCLTQRYEGLIHYLAKIAYDFERGFYIELFIFDSCQDIDTKSICDGWLAVTNGIGTAYCGELSTTVNLHAHLNYLCHANKQFVLNPDLSLWIAS